MHHSGHIAFLRETSVYENVHIGLGSDKTIQQIMGIELINSEEERLYKLSAL
jgi:glycerol-3-phosphate cytidylyltransferase-like family protein